MNKEKWFRINECRYQPSTATLEREGQKIRLELKLAKALDCFLQKQGQVVSKSDLIQFVWGYEAVSDESVVRVISKLRKALGDARYIETLPKVGYRLTVQVREESVSKKGQTGSKKVGLVVVLLIVLFTVYFFWSNGFSKASSSELDQISLLLETPGDNNFIRAFDLLNQEATQGSTEAHGWIAMMYAYVFGDYISIDSVNREANFQFHLENSLDDSRDSTLWLIAMGTHAFHREYDPETAERYLRKAITLSPNNQWANHILSMVLANKEQFGEAITRIGVVVRSNPENELAQWDRIWFYHLAGENILALESIREIEQITGRVSGWTKMLVYHALEDHLSAAKSWFDRNQKTNYTAAELSKMEKLLDAKNSTGFFEYLIEINTPSIGRHEDPEALAIWSMVLGRETEAQSYIDASLTYGHRPYTQWFALMDIFEPLYQK